MNTNRTTKRLGIPVLPAILAVGSFNSALALELGDINVRSTLGQPLRASIAYALAPNEQLPGNCVSLVPADGYSGAPAISSAKISVSANSIEIAGTSAVREPVISARIQIRCPYAPSITREYVMLVDPAAMVFDTRQAQAPTAIRERAVDITSAPPPRREPAAEQTPVLPGSSYRVQSGDSLFGIARRLEEHQPNPARAAAAIFSANPKAFIASDPDRLMAGAVLDIPGPAELLASFPQNTIAGSDTSEPSQDSTSTMADDTAYLAPATIEPEAGLGETPTVRVVGGMQIQSAIDAVANLNDEAESADQAAENWQSEVAASVAAMPAPPRQAVSESIEPSAPEVQAGTAAPEVEAGATAVEPQADPAAPDAQAEPPVPEVAADTPAPESRPQPVDQPVATAAEASSGGMLWWILGSVLVLVGGIFFWRRREAGDKAADAIPVPAPAPEQAFPVADDSIEVEVINSLDADAGLDFDLSDDAPTEENPQLAADPFEDVDTATANLQAEDSEPTAVEETASPEPAAAPSAAATSAVPDETVTADNPDDEEEAAEVDSSATDIIPPLSRQTESILQEEVLPGEHDYDISVIMDITKARPPEEATEKDLKAVFVDFTETTINQDGYSLNQEMDYQILDQEYDDDLSATQAVNLEIEKATKDMMASLGDELSFESEILSAQDATDLRIAGISETSVNASIDAENDDFSELDDTSVNELTANMKVGDRSPETGSSSG